MCYKTFEKENSPIPPPMLTTIFIGKRILFLFLLQNGNLVSREALEKSSFFATQLLWISILVLLTSFRVCSAFLFLLVSLFPLLFRTFLLDILISPELRKSSDRSMFGLAYVVSMAASVGIPLMLLIQFHVGMFQMFVPLMGRSGSALPPDVAIGLLTCFVVSSATPHMVSVKRNKLMILK